MPRAFQFLSCAVALLGTLAFKAGAQAIESDSSVPGSKAGGNGIFEANLMTADGSRRGLSDFAIELNFRTPNPAGDRFDLEIKSENTAAGSTTAMSPGNPILHLSYEAQTGWRVATGTQRTTAWQPISELAGVSPGGVVSLSFDGAELGRNQRLLQSATLGTARSTDLKSVRFATRECE